MELTPKFSKAPWKIETNHSGVVIGVSAFNPAHDLDFVCEFETGIKSKREINKVNAALIKTAPKLWECLYKIINCDNMGDSMELFERAERLLIEANGDKGD